LAANYSPHTISPIEEADYRLHITLLTLLALGLRCFGIAEWSFVDDEYFTVFHGGERLFVAVNPALYQLVYLSTSVFGVSEWSVRLPSVLLGTACVPVFYATWRHIIGSRAALYGAAIVVFSLWHIWHSQYARFYAPTFLFTSLTYYFFYRALQQDSIKMLIYTFVFSAISCLFHLTAVFAVASCALFSLFVVANATLQAAGLSRRIALWHAGIHSFFGLIALPFLLGVLSTWQISNQFWGYGAVGISLQIAKWIQVPVALAAAFGLLFMFRRAPARAVFFLTGIGVPVIALLLASSILTVRADYIFASMALVYGLAGYLCAQPLGILDSAPTREVNNIPAVLIIVLASMLPETLSHFLGRSTLDLRDVTSFVEQTYEPQDRVAPLINEHNFFQYYANFSYPEEGVLGDPLDPGVDWLSVMKPFASHAHCSWVVVPIRRRPISPDLEAWLFKNAQLVWRKISRRYDYNITGYEVYVAGAQRLRCTARAANL